MKDVIYDAIGCPEAIQCSGVIYLMPGGHLMLRHCIYDAIQFPGVIRCCTMSYNAVKLGKNPALPGPHLLILQL